MTELFKVHGGEVHVISTRWKSILLIYSKYTEEKYTELPHGQSRYHWVIQSTQRRSTLSCHTVKVDTTELFKVYRWEVHWVATRGESRYYWVIQSTQRRSTLSCQAVKVDTTELWDSSWLVGKEVKQLTWIKVLTISCFVRQLTRALCLFIHTQWDKRKQLVNLIPIIWQMIRSTHHVTDDPKQSLHEIAPCQYRGCLGQMYTLSF